MAGFKSLNSQRRIGGFSLDVYHPDFNHPVPTTSRLDTDATQVEYGFYSNDQIDVDPYWHISGGLRYSLFDSDSVKNGTEPTLSKQQAMTYSAGLSFTPSQQLAVYYGYSQSFQPNTGADHNLDYLPAKRGELHEVGIKSQWLQKRLGINTSVYRLSQTNLPGRDPVYSDYVVAIGEIHSQGIEFDLTGQATDHLQLLGNYSWLEAEFGHATALQGNRFRSTPKNTVVISGLATNCH